MRALLLRHHECIRQAASLRSRYFSGGQTALDVGVRPIRTLLEEHDADKDKTERGNEKVLKILGHVRAVRSHRRVTFIDVTDGSLAGDATLQVVLRRATPDELSIGASLELTGHLQRSKGVDQPFEFAANDISITASCETAAFPLATSLLQTPTLLRKYAHLRSRNARHASVLKSRDLVERTICAYFHKTHFTKVAAPIITSSDCEGGGEVFTVQASNASEDTTNKKSVDLDAELAEEPSLSGSTPDPASKETSSLSNIGLEPSLGGSASDVARSTDTYRSYWADTMAYLTVSSQLHLESIAYGLGRVYTIGPSFRAESSATNRHLAEFWMCEAEMMTIEETGPALESVISIVENLTKEVIAATSQGEEAAFLWCDDVSGLQELSTICHQPWPRMKYTEAIEHLDEHSDLFSIQPQWGDALAIEHERWLARNGPVFITDYPSSIKPFYMKVNEKDGKGRETVACFDLLVPRLGELVGGSLREDRADVLRTRLAEASSSSTIPEHLQWYVSDLRRFGSGPHGGFGLGVERLLSWVTNTDNLRDCITFPRVKGPLRY